MKRRIKIGEALAFSGISSVTGFFLYLMLSVFVAQIISDYYLLNASEGMGTLTVITIGGFALGIIVSMFISALVSRFSQRTIPSNYMIIASVLSFIGNLIMWYIISFIGLLIAYPQVLDGLYIWEFITVFPQALATFGIYVIKPNLTWLWMYSVVTYAMFYGIFIWWLGTPYEDSKKKLKKEMFKYDK